MAAEEAQMTAERIIGASAWEQEMYDYLKAHGEVEEEILEEYRMVAEDEESSAAFRYLARLILADEVRHHQTFEDLAEAMRQMGEVRVEDEPIPPLGGLRRDRDRVLDVTQRLLSVEREDAKELRRLSKELEDFRETTLWGLLVELMLDDTAKHIKILNFIRDRSRDTFV